MVPLAKFDISLKNTPPGLAPFCTESWQRFPTIFFSILFVPTNIVVSDHTKNYGKTKRIYGKTRKPLRRREVLGSRRCYNNKSPYVLLYFEPQAFDTLVMDTAPCYHTSTIWTTLWMIDHE